MLSLIRHLSSYWGRGLARARALPDGWPILGTAPHANIQLHRLYPRCDPFAVSTSARRGENPVTGVPGQEGEGHMLVGYVRVGMSHRLSHNGGSRQRRKADNLHHKFV